MKIWTKEVTKRTKDFSEKEKAELEQFIFFIKIKGRLKIDSFGKVFAHI